MNSQTDIKDYEILFVVVNFGVGSKIIRSMKNHGLNGGTAFLGKGTIKNHFLELLDLNDIRKEIIFSMAESVVIQEAANGIVKEFAFHKANHGIAFTIAVANLIGVRNCSYTEKKEGRGVDIAMQHAIFVVVDRGQAEFVIEAAEAAGSKGGTIINGRGSGVHETQKVFNIEIEPEKEIVMILAEDAITDKIVDKIREELNIDEPGKGILFVLDVSKTFGLY
ncbi:MAG: P-II family nitrogen regulator [Clostridiales bacterium]|nr:P-II family nitrogen regulator [Clostridiales bacterium]